MDTSGIDDLRAHADFIRELADRLAPDWAVQIATDVGPEVSNTIRTSIVAATGRISAHSSRAALRTALPDM